MGMAASQARLLSITARMSNNEHAGQTVSYAKQRLADQTQQITNEYNEALNATKLTVLTGFNGAQANYEDISYNLMTGLQMAESTKQYVVTDTKGKVLVTNEIAKAYEKSHGNINRFLADLGYSIADINVQKTYADVENRTPSQVATEQQIHEAWDKYFQTIYLDYVSPNAQQMHDFGFSWTETFDTKTGNSSIGDGYAGYARTNRYEQAVDEKGNKIYSEKLETTKEVPVLDEYGNPKYSKELGYEYSKSDYTFDFGSGTETIKPVQIRNDGSVNFNYGELNHGNRPIFINDSEDHYTIYKLSTDTNDYTNGDNTHYTVISVEEGTANYDKYLKYVPYFDYSKEPVQKYAKSGIIYDTNSEPETKTIVGVGGYDPSSEPIYDYSKPIYEKDKNGNLIYDPINYEGTTQESRDLYDYAMAITEAYLRVNPNSSGVDFKVQYDLKEFKSANNLDNNSALKYYKNIFNKIQSSGYFTYTNTPAEIDENHVYTSEGTGTKGNVQKNPLKDNYTFEAALRDGSLRLEYYSSTKKSFQATTISEDNCIQEVIDERAIARAESKYNQDMADLENKDKKFDLDLKRLDTEHNALQTEYDSVKNVVDKNVESSFKIFS